jgi:hypothetical protein
MKKCEQCGAPLEFNSLKCEYCNSNFQSKDSNTKLKDFVIYIEDQFNSVKDEFDLQVGFSFIFLATLWGITSYAAYQELNLIAFLLVLIISGSIFFVIFGFSVIYYQTKAVKLKFQSRYKSEILQFLQDYRFTKIDLNKEIKITLNPDCYFLKIFDDL